MAADIPYDDTGRQPQEAAMSNETNVESTSTATDDAILAMAAAMEERWDREALENRSDPTLDAETALNAIPANLLAAMAIERGGLIASWFVVDGSGGAYSRSPEWTVPDHHRRLYLLANPADG